VSELAKTSPSASEVERVKLEFNLRLEEYKSLRAEVNQHVLFQHQTMTTIFAGFAALVAGAKFIRDDAPLLFIIASWFFLGLIWTQLRYARVVIDIDRYIGEVLKKDFINLLNALDSEEDKNRPVLSYYGREGSNVYGRGLIGIVLDGARYGIALLVALLLSVSYFIVVDRFYMLRWYYDVPLGLLQTGLIAFTVVSILKIRNEAITVWSLKQDTNTSESSVKTTL
jgi:hypothetical protein